MKPYEIHIWVDGKRQDSHHVDDPFHTTTVVTGWNLWDWFKMLFRRNREVKTVVKLTAHKAYAINAVMNALHHDCVRCGTGSLDTHGDHVNDPPVVQRSGMGTANG